MDKVSESPFISLQPSQFTPHTTVIHFRAEKPAESSSSGSRVRRFHHKTRTGCRECKQKRRKCNEGKPSCQGCLKSKIECHYEDVIPPRVQPKNRKRPQRKPAPNRFVFIEFGETGTTTTSTTDSQHHHPLNPPGDSDSSSTSGAQITRWQSAPSTCLLQGGRTRSDTGGMITKEVEFIYLFRNFTSRTLPLQAYDKDRWSRMTFESCYSESYLYDIMIALAASHQRFLQGLLARTAKEISHYVKALAGFRAVVSNPGNFATMDLNAWISVLTTAALLSMYIMSCPVDNYETSCDTYFSLTRGTMSMLGETMKRGVDLGFKASEFTPQETTMALEVERSQKTAVFPGLEYAASGDDRATGPKAAQRLSDILTIISLHDGHGFSIDAVTATNLQKIALEWAAMPDALHLHTFRAKNKKAYLVTAHYHAGLWKVREIIRSLCKRGLWGEANGAVDSFWWMISPEGICKRSLEMLVDEPRERISWVERVVRELESIE
ncbi:hypothetical protein TWF506_005806 [Arthrobotrys conoides]|uniref:Zn(2)-C6 fungal-type domain-containing protein n=1 Tax=Arthrobotrys conoides TaxID=74498 RepID=A0AAN8S0E6_9PEZI